MRAFIGFLGWIVVLFIVFSCESKVSIRNSGEGGAAGAGPSASGEGGSESGGDAGAPAQAAGRAGADGGGGQPAAGAAGAPSAGAAGQGGALDNGSPCTDDADCSSGSCADGVCCDEPCTGECRSCLAEHTGSQQGQCAPVTSGTSCGAETCEDGANQSTELSARTCNGSGVCSEAGDSNSCGLFRCGGDECRDSCSETSHCVSDSYCDSPNCVPKKTRGAVCAGPDQCDTGICGGSQPNVRGGRCCAIPCDCPQPSAQNLLDNPGFEDDLSGWDIDLEDNFPDVPADAEWSSLWDSDNCGDGNSYSGGLEVTIGGISHVTVRQCVPATAGVTYNMGGWFLASELPEGHPAGDAPWSASCSVQFFSSMNVCNTGFPQLGSQSVALHNEIDSTYTWKAFNASTVAPASTTAAAFDCFMVDDFAPEMSVILDKLYLSPAPAQY